MWLWYRRLICTLSRLSFTEENCRSVWIVIKLNCSNNSKLLTRWAHRWTQVIVKSIWVFQKETYFLWFAVFSLLLHLFLFCFVILHCCLIPIWTFRPKNYRKCHQRPAIFLLFVPSLLLLLLKTTPDCQNMQIYLSKNADILIKPCPLHTVDKNKWKTSTVNLLTCIPRVFISWNHWVFQVFTTVTLPQASWLTLIRPRPVSQWHSLLPHLQPEPSERHFYCLHDVAQSTLSVGSCYVHVFAHRVAAESPSARFYSRTPGTPPSSLTIFCSLYFSPFPSSAYSILSSQETISYSKTKCFVAFEPKMMSGLSLK